jgi:hypothetical protein
MIVTVDDLVQALQKFPKTARVQADHKPIQSVSSGNSANPVNTVEISTTATPTS